MLDLRLPPLDLANSIYHNAVEKVSHTQALDMIQKYFQIFNSQEKFKFDIAKELTLIASIAEVYTDDPVYVLFQCGIVAFPEINCFKLTKLCEILNVDSKLIEKSFKKYNFIKFTNLPESFNETLFRLGYFDSIDWNIFYIPQNNSFSFHLLKHKIFIQTFPADLVDVLSSTVTAFTDLYAKRREIITAVTSENDEEEQEEEIHEQPQISANEHISQDETAPRRSERIKQKEGKYNFIEPDYDFYYSDDYYSDDSHV